MENVAFEAIDSNRQSWESWRRSRIGSSEVATILGLNPFQTPLDLWLEKTGKKERFAGSIATKFGHALEPVIGEEFLARHSEMTGSRPMKTFNHPEAEWAIASPDYDLTAPDREGPGILEVKWSTMRTRWESEIPTYAHVQIVWQLGVTGRTWGFLTAGLIDHGGTLVEYPITFDKSIFDALFEESAKFHEMIQKDIPPKAQAGDLRNVERLFNRVEGKRIALGTEAESWVQKLEAAKLAADPLKENLKVYEKCEKEAKANLIAAFGDATEGELSDGRVVKLKTITVGEKMTKGYSYILVDVR